MCGGLSGGTVTDVHLALNVIGSDLTWLSAVVPVCVPLEDTGRRVCEVAFTLAERPLGTDAVSTEEVVALIVELVADAVDNTEETNKWTFVGVNVPVGLIEEDTWT